MARPAERDVVAAAKKIADAGSGVRSRVFSMSRATEALLERAMSDDDFRVQLFRFVDVFPACRDDEDVMRHVREYFSEDAPKIMQRAVRTADRIWFGERITASIARKNIERMASQFIAGSDAASAIDTLGYLWSQNEAFTVDLLGEKTVTSAEADRYAARVNRILTELTARTADWPHKESLESDHHGRVPRVNVSVKPTALSPKFDPLHTGAITDVFDRLAPICEKAAQLGATIHVDMEHYDVKDLTYGLLTRLGSEFRRTLNLGCVVQAYLRSAPRDLELLIEWSAKTLTIPLQIRLVKGAYWDSETIHARAEGWPVPVWSHKGDTDACYEHCVDQMVAAADRIRPAFASHNLRSLGYAAAAARSSGLPANAIEFQLLNGMAEPVHRALAKSGVRTRSYVPVGELIPGMAYLVRRLLENTSQTSFVRHRFAEGQDLETLLRPPTTVEFPDGVDVKPVPNFPPINYRDSSALGALTAAAEAPRSEVSVPAVIAAQQISRNDELVSVNPARPSERVATVTACTASEAASAVDSASRAQPAWDAIGVDARAQVIRNAASILTRDRDELVATIVAEAGKPLLEADADVGEAIDFCNYYAAAAVRLFAPSPLWQVPGEKNTYLHRPMGVWGVISPWNFPLAIPCGQIVAPLVCGNAVVFKPAEQTPLVGYELAKRLWEAGVPQDVLQFVPGYGEVAGAAIVEHPLTAGIAFTGSKAVGLNISAAAAKVVAGQRRVKRVIAEMGGKNAIIVDTDADLDVAVPNIIKSAFGYAGQKCSAASRVFAVGDTLRPLLERLVGAAEHVTVADPAQPTTQVGPVIDPESVERFRRYTEAAEREGTIVFASKSIPQNGYFVPPTIVHVTDPRVSCATEEIFAPMFTVYGTRSVEEAVALTNENDYALTGGVFSRSPSTIEYVTTNLRAGNIYVNRGITGAIVGRQPFGGFGMSGVGSKAGGPEYLHQFVDPVVVTENTVRQGFSPDL